MSNLVDHARRELELCGQFEEDPQFAQSVLAAVAAFASYGGHSGGSAMAGIHMLSDLLNFKNLSPLTNNPDEWIRHTPDMWDGEHHVWQNTRNGSAFSHDGGLTYELMDQDKRAQPYRTMITHTMEGLPIKPVGAKGNEHDAVAESIDLGEAMGIASASMAEPSDFYGGESDAAEPVQMRRVPNGSGYDEIPVKEEGN